MKNTKLNARGFSHELLLLVIVVVVAIGGVGLLVNSHADSLTAAKPKGKCSISKIPRKPKPYTTISPVVTVKNLGKKDFAPHLVLQLGYGTRSQPFQKGAASLSSVDLPMLKAKKSEKLTLTSFAVPEGSSARRIGTYLVQSVDPKFECSVKFTLPVLMKY